MFYGNIHTNNDDELVCENSYTAKFGITILEEDDTESLQEGLFFKSAEFKELKEKIKEVCNKYGRKNFRGTYSTNFNREIANKTVKDICAISKTLYVSPYFKEQYNGAYGSTFWANYAVIYMLYKNKFFVIQLVLGTDSANLAVLQEPKPKYDNDLIMHILKMVPDRKCVFAFLKSKIGITNAGKELVNKIVDSVNKTFAGKYEASYGTGIFSSGDIKIKVLYK